MGDELDVEQLNLIANLLQINFHIREELSLTTLDSEYCNLSLDILDNQGSETEYIVTGDLKINFTNPKYNIPYWLKLKYYDLKDGDINDSHDYDTLKERVIKLNTGANIISFDEPIVYLQQECELTIKNDGG